MLGLYDVLVHMAVVHKLIGGPFFVGLKIRALLLGVSVRGPDFWGLPQNETTLIPNSNSF